jgi:hypothetical protein
VLHQVVAEVVTDRVVVPPRGQQVLHAIGAVVPDVLGQAPAGLSGQLGQQSEHERFGATAGFYAGEPAGDAAQQLVEDLLPAGRGYAVAGGHRW